MPEPDNDTFEHEWEAFDAGKWNGVDITRQHLNEIASNFRKLKTNLRVPVKLGHKKNQPKTDDGQPALGWIDDVWVNSVGKLMVHAIDMPKIVYEAVKKKLYKTSSIETLFDVEYKGDNLGTVLTAVALLGADLPAVNTLDDLQTYLTSNASTNEMNFSRRVLFTTKEEKIMPKTVEELEAELAAEKAKSAKLESETQEFSSKYKASEAEKAKLQFDSRKDKAFSRLEKLVTEKKCTPAKRDELMSQYSVDSADKVDIKIETIEEMEFKLMSDSDNKDTSHGKGDKDKHDDPQDELDAKIRAFSAEHDVDYSVAAERVMFSNQSLARDYIESVGEV